MRFPLFRAARHTASQRPGRLAAGLALLSVLTLLLAACSAPQSTQLEESGTSPQGKLAPESPLAFDSSVEDASGEIAVLPKSSNAAAFLAGKYVSVSGNNSNGGTSPADAWRTLAFAVKQLNPGDTLWVMDGIYSESERSDAAVLVTKSGTPSAWITITAHPGATPVIKAHHANGFKIEGASYVEVSGFEFQGTYDAGRNQYSGAGIAADSIWIPSGTPENHHIRILNNKISGFGAGGIPVTGSSHVEIRNNVVHNVAREDHNQHSGISIFEPHNMGHGNDGNGYSNYITGNIVYQAENIVRNSNGGLTDGNCIIMDRTEISNYTGRTLIANNLCVDNGGRAIQIFESAHVDVVNNTAYRNMRTPEIGNSGGELGSFYSNDVVFANNLVFASDGRKPARVFDSYNIRFENNLYVGNTGSEYGGASNSGDRTVSGGTSVASGPSTAANPANFELTTGSPALNAGTNRFGNVVSTDLAGRTRQIGGAVDIGALESGSTTPPVTATPTTRPPTTAAPTTTRPPTTAAPTTRPPVTTTQPSRPPTTAASSSRPTTTRTPTTASSSKPLPTTPATTGGPATTSPTKTSTTVVRPPTTIVDTTAATTTASTTTASTTTASTTTGASSSTTAAPSSTAGGPSSTGPVATTPRTSTTSRTSTTELVTVPDSDSSVAPGSADPGNRYPVIVFDPDAEPDAAVLGSAASEPPPGAGPNAVDAAETSDAGAADRSASPSIVPGTEQAPGELAFIDSPRTPEGPSPIIPLTLIFGVSMLGAWQYTRPSRRVGA